MAINLNAQGKYAQAQPLLEKALEINRRLLTDDHRNTATSYNNLAVNLDYPGEVRRRPSHCYEKALEIRRRLLTENTPTPPKVTPTWRPTCILQGKYTQAQSLFEKALEINRRLLTDDHPDTAISYNNLALNLNAQGKYAQAQPLLREGAGDPPPPAH